METYFAITNTFFRDEKKSEHGYYIVQAENFETADRLCRESNTGAMIVCKVSQLPVIVYDPDGKAAQN